MNIFEGTYGFQFNHNQIVYYQIQPMVGDSFATIVHLNLPLSLESNVAVLKLNAKSFLIGAFQIPRTQGAVNLNGCPNNLFGEFLFFHSWIPGFLIKFLDARLCAGGP